MFMRLLTGLDNASNHTNCVLLGNQKCTTQLTLINLHPNQYTQGLHYFPFAVNLDRREGRCTTLNDLSNKLCGPNKAEYLNISVFKTITGINECKTLTKHVLCKYKCKFDGRKCNSNQMSDNDKYWCECKII